MTDKETIDYALNRTIIDIDNVLAPVTRTDEAGSEIYQRFEVALNLTKERLTIIWEAFVTDKPIKISQKLWEPVLTEDELLDDIEDEEEDQ